MWHNEVIKRKQCGEKRERKKHTSLDPRSAASAARFPTRKWERIAAFHGGNEETLRSEERGKRFLTTIKLSSRSQLDLNMSLTPSLIQCFIYGMGCFFLVEARFAVTNQLEATNPAKIKKCEERISKDGIFFLFHFLSIQKMLVPQGLFQNPDEIH